MSRTPLRLLAISREGSLATLAPSLPPEARDVVAAFTSIPTASYRPPWIGYFAIEDGVIVGTCAFKSPPVDGAVEIAYYTFPAHEGRGVATRMARALIELARSTDPAIRLFAQTLPHESASTAILRRLGFEHTRDVQHPADGLVWEWHLPVR